MVSMSKFSSPAVKKEWLIALDHECHELAHTWSNSCTDAAWIIFKSSFKESLKIYSIFYTISLLLRRPKRKDVDFARISKDILRSSLFLTSNAVLFIVVLCIIRRGCGCFVLPNIGFTNSFIASFLSILIERKNRRSVLALYLTQLASEVGFRMLVNHKIVNPLPYGEVFMLSIALSAYFYLLRTHQLHDKDAIQAIRFVFDLDRNEQKLIGIPLNIIPSFVTRPFVFLRQYFSRQYLCQHANSCVSVATEAFIRNFVFSFSGVVMVKLALSFKDLRKQPFLVVKKICQNSLKGPMCLSTLPAAYRALICIFRRLFKSDSALFHSLAAFLAAGFSGVFKSSSTVSLYVLWKLVETLYFLGIRQGFLPYFKHFDVLLYSFSTAFVLFAGVMEPHALRQSYWKFLVDLTGTNFAKVNRRVLDVYGFDSSKIMGSP